MFQYWTVTPLNLGYVAIVTTLNLYLLPHLFLLYFWIFIFHPPYYCSPSITGRSSLYISLCFVPAPHLLSRREAPPNWTSPKAASLRWLSLRPEPRACVWTRLLWLCNPPFVTLGLRLDPCQILGFLPITGPSISPVPSPHLNWDPPQIKLTSLMSTSLYFILLKFTNMYILLHWTRY